MATPSRNEVEPAIMSLTMQLQHRMRLRDDQQQSVAAGNAAASTTTVVDDAARATRTFKPDDARRLARAFGNGTVEPDCVRMMQTLRHLNREIERYEDTSLQEKALGLLPLQLLYDRAAELQKGSGTRDLDFQDYLAQTLVEWTKKECLRWVDPVKCMICGGETDGVGSTEPTSMDELSNGAGRVELYRCPRSTEHPLTRFPRYSRLERLLETRTGRCGEFAAIFMLFLRALGFRARYIWNSEDHVWNEYYSDHMKRWVHLDSCEGARDKNLLYDLGWGKKMKYCVAFGLEGAKDVTRSYVSDWRQTLRRRNAVWHQPLIATLAALTAARRVRISKEDATRCVKEDEDEESWLRNDTARQAAANMENLGGRSSGTEEWKRMRSEDGQATVSGSNRLKRIRKLEFTATTDIVCNGSAKIIGSSTIALTQDRPDQAGSAFFALPKEVASFAASFTFHISHPGADGMAFVIHRAPSQRESLGSGGCQLGYGGIPSSVAVEIDTYRSQDRCDDPPTPHISVHSVGSLPNDAHHHASLWCSRPGHIPNLDDGKKYRMCVEVSNIRSMRIFLAEETGDWVDLTASGNVVLRSLGSNQICLGWTAATGGICQSHTVVDFEVWECESVAVEQDTI